MGCKNMIIAASGDGILIADKERSGYMKPYVEKIETEAMYIEKSWGSIQAYLSKFTNFSVFLLSL